MMVLKLSCIAALALVIVIDCYASIEIERGDHDTFGNPTCLSQTVCNCSGFNASCIPPLCVKCECSGDYKTFLPSVDEFGSCVKDIYLLFFPSDTNSFLVQETKRSQICLRHRRPSNFPNTDFVIGTTCDSNDPTQHWIWTQYNQLLNLDTLKCLQQNTSYRYAYNTNYYYLFLGNCVTADIKQTWDCNYNMYFRLPLTNSYKYMSYGVYKSFILAGPRYSYLYTTWRRRYQYGVTLCSKAFGCNEFSNPSSAIFVTDINCIQCQGEKQINVPQNYYNCYIVWDQSTFLGYGWKQLPFTEKIFTIVHSGVHNGDTFLKWNFTNASYKWSGLIVKLQFSCTDQSSGYQLDKCILIKFKGKHTDPTTGPPTEPSTRVVSTKFSTTAKTPTSGALLTTASTPDEIKPTPTLSPRPTSFPSPTNPTDEIKPTPTLSPRPTSFPSPTDGSSPLTSKMSNTTSVRERQKSEPLNVVSIVVPLVVIILVLCGVLGFIFYKRRRSHAKESPAAKDQDSNDKGGSSVRQTSVDTLNPIYSPADNSFAPHCSDDGGAYQEPTSGASQVCNLYESGGDHDYDYAKVDQNDHRTPLPEETYDYANSNDIRPVAQPNAGINKKTPKHACESKVEGEENTCPLYQTLEDSSANGLEMSPITNNNKKDPNESNVEGGGENMSPVYQTLEDPYENE